MVDGHGAAGAVQVAHHERPAGGCRLDDGRRKAGVEHQVRAGVSRWVRRMISVESRRVRRMVGVKPGWVRRMMLPESDMARRVVMVEPGWVRRRMVGAGGPVDVMVGDLIREIRVDGRRAVDEGRR
jgi:hypothetical protein